MLNSVEFHLSYIFKGSHKMWRCFITLQYHASSYWHTCIMATVILPRPELHIHLLQSKDAKLLKKRYSYNRYTLTVSDSRVTASVKTFMNVSSFIFNLFVLDCKVCFMTEDGIHAGHHQSKLMTTCQVT
jgi:hypothetical protein